MNTAMRTAAYHENDCFGNGLFCECETVISFIQERWKSEQSQSFKFFRGISALHCQNVLLFS
jgi:hypothetical protein